jgi:hypothetical protein
LAVLAHHDDGRCVSRLEGKNQVQQNEGKRVPMSDECYHVQHDPNAKKDALDDDEAPRTNCSATRSASIAPGVSASLGKLRAGF